MIKSVVKIGVGLMAGMVISAGVAQAASVEGVWRTEAGWKVKMYKCGASYCGKVVGGVTGKDVKNSNKALRNRNIVGIRMIWGMKKNKSGFAGKLYNAKDGKTYTGKITNVGSKSMKLSGCAFGGLICRSQTWRK